jgi:hypothetical protein
MCLVNQRMNDLLVTAVNPIENSDRHPGILKVSFIK